jgi:hypothetical protein
VKYLKSTSKGKDNLKNKQYIYFCRIGEPADRLFKIGTTNNIKRRMSEHKRSYKKDIEVLGVIEVTSKYTTLRVEEQTIEKWKMNEGWEYHRNDRFTIPPEVTEVTIKVKKEYKFSAV